MPIARTETSEPGGSLVPIYIEVDTLDTLDAPDDTSVYDEEETRQDAAQKVLTVAGDVFSDGVDLVRDCAAKVAHGLTHLPDGVRKPDELEVQLAIKVDATFGAVLAKLSPGALMQVTMRWRLGDDE
jgi:hypothetical protein